MITSLVVTFYLGSIAGAWKLLLVTGAGTGTVLLLRWFWWRINAWSEVSAMITAAIVSLSLQLIWHWDSDDPKQFAYLMLITVGITSVVWLTVTMLTAPEPMDKLVAFYRRVYPEGPGWKNVARAAGLTSTHRGSLAGQFANWILGCALIYGSLFGIGKLIFKEYGLAALYLLIAIVAGVLITRNLSRIGWQTESAPEAGDNVALES
jgi:hypothetical protein